MTLTSSDSVQIYSAYIKALREYESEDSIYINEDAGKLRRIKINEMVDKLSTEDLPDEERKRCLETLWLHVCFYIVKELKKYNLPKHVFEDALQNSFIKLAQKAHKYDPYFNPDHKTSFVGFLSRCRTISNALQDALSDNQVVREARGARQDLVNKYKAEEDGEDLEKVSSVEYNDFMEVDLTKENPTRSSSERDIYNRELQAVFSAIFTDDFLLTYRERIALLAKFGVLGHQQMTLNELQDYFESMGKKLSVARICQIQGEALDKVRNYLTKNLGVDSELIS